MKMKHDTSRREMLQLSCAGLLGLLGWKSSAKDSRLSPIGKKTLDHLGDLSLDKKVKEFQRLYEQVAFHESGIMYSMLRLDESGVRPFAPGDFKGQWCLDSTVGKFQLSGPHDYLHGENSISVSGLYLAAQTYRYLATGSKQALHQAAKAFSSLDAIYQMGVEAQKPGWMSKPYGFKPSNQTSCDQYLDASWGLFTYHAIASPVDKRRIEEMLIAFADHWRSCDYVLSYFGSNWDMKGETDSYNAIFVMMNAIAYHFTKNPLYRKEAEKIMERETWTRTTRLEILRESVQNQIREKGKAEIVPYSAAFSLVKDILKPGEILCWETTIHTKFVVVATDVISQVMPELLGGKASEIRAKWWSEWKYGIPDDFLPYYWFAVDLVNDTWRPLPNTPPLPKENWLFGDPFCSYISQVRWNDPLARFMISSALSAKHKNEQSESARTVGLKMMESIDSVHLHWLYDPDGRQLIPEIRYYGECLSSELPGSFLAAYWLGRYHRCW